VGHTHTEHGHNDEHGHEDEHGHNEHGHNEHGHNEHGHNEDEHKSLWARVKHLVAPHSHDSVDKVDSALESSREGLRALWISLAVLGATAALQAVVVVWSGSVALLSDTLHNVADALTALPLAMAFIVGRRLPNRRYTYGYGRAEDLAGIVIVLVIAGSAILAGYEAVDRLLNPKEVNYLGIVALAGLIGFVGNEFVAQLRIRVGKRIGSAALVADGLHARTDGFTSLAVLLSAGGVALGWGWADPVVGLAITVAILFVLKDAAREVYRRLMDAVDPAILDACEQALLRTDGVQGVGELRLRWLGHRLRAECAIVVDPQLSLVDAHAIAVDAEHRLLHDVPKLSAALVHADPAPTGGRDHHEDLAHHRETH
jgi:cation diffusion facilitator family transporter